MAARLFLFLFSEHEQEAMRNVRCKAQAQLIM